MRLAGSTDPGREGAEPPFGALLRSAHLRSAGVTRDEKSDTRSAVACTFHRPAEGGPRVSALARYVHARADAMLPKKEPRDVLWTLDDCDAADLGPDSRRQLGLSDEEIALYTSDLIPRPILAESGEIPAVSEDQAREILAKPRKTRAA